MKRLFKILAAVLVAVLVVGTVPTQTADAAVKLSLAKTSKTLYLGTCIGQKADGTKATYAKSFKVTKSVVKNLDTSKMDVKLTSSDKSVVTTNNSKDRVTAVGIGTATVTVKVYDSAKKLIFTDKVKVTVKKNASTETFSYSGIKNGDTYAAGESVTVSIPKSSDDTDARRLVCDDKNVSVSALNSSKTRFKVTFNKAGSYELRVEAYQSSTYSKATVSVKVNVTVKGDSEKADPTLTPTPTPTADVKEKISQTESRVLVYEGKEVADTLKPANIEIYHYISGSNYKYADSSRIASVVVMDKKAYIQLYSALEDNTEYYVSVKGGEALKFKTCGTQKSDVVSIELLTTKALVGQETTLEFKFRTKEGVDISDEVSSAFVSNGDLTTSVIQGDLGVTNAYSNKITMYEAGKTAVLECTFITGMTANYEPVKIVVKGAISSYEKAAAQLSNVLYSFVKDDALYLTSADTCVHEIAKGDDRALEVLFAYMADGKTTYTKLSDANVRLSSGDPTILMVTGTAPMGGGASVVALKEGTTSIIVYDNKTNKAIYSMEVKVKPARYAYSLVATPSKSILNVNPSVGDSLEIKAVVRDQYNEIMENAPLSIVQKEITQTVTGYVGFGGFVNGVCTVQGSDCSITGSQNGIAATVSVIGTNLSQGISFTVKNVAYDPSKTYTAQPVVEGKTVIDTTVYPGTQTVESTYVYLNFLDNGVFVKETAGKKLTATPTGGSKCTDFGVTAGTTFLGYTIMRDGVIVTTDACIDTSDPNNIEFKPIIAGGKLTKGTYTITFFNITANATSSICKGLGSTVIRVVENPLEVKKVKLTDKATVMPSWPSSIGTFFEFYIDGVKVDNSCITDAKVVTDVSNNSYIDSVTLTLTNSVYGSYQVIVPVGEIVSYTAK